MVTHTEQAILDTLVELETSAAKMATAQPKPDLRPLFKRLDELAAALPPEAPGDLRHYLQRKSYQKARAFLEER